jgi:hypothetical protein
MCRQILVKLRGIKLKKIKLSQIITYGQTGDQIGMTTLMRVFLKRFVLSRPKTYAGRQIKRWIDQTRLGLILEIDETEG